MGVVGSVTTWCTHWLCWCCPLPSHTHRACEARGGGGCVWCGCHHHCAPFPPTTTTVCAAPPCPLCVCVWWWDWAQRRTVVARTLVWRCAWRLATTPTSHAVHACRLSPLSCPQTHPPTHKWHCSLHTHMACFVCLVPSTHSHTGCLTAHTPSTHTGGCACAHPPALMRHHTHSAGTGVALAWLLWCCGHHHHAPCATHTHRDWWWAPWWWLVVGVWALCGCHATPPTRLACHHTRHIHHHTHHGVLFVWHALPLPPPPLNPITHTPQQPLCHNGGCHWSPRRPHTLATHATHTPRASTGVAVAFGVAPPPRWCWPFAVFSSSLLVHQPLSLSLACTLTPHPLINNTTIPSIPCVWCVCCGNGLMDGPHCG